MRENKDARVSGVFGVAGGVCGCLARLSAYITTINCMQQLLAMTFTLTVAVAVAAAGLAALFSSAAVAAASASVASVAVAVAATGCRRP